MTNGYRVIAAADMAILDEAYLAGHLREAASISALASNGALHIHAASECSRILTLTRLYNRFAS